ncbi:hypothetical protein GCM10009747_32050 [Agromyces humatus]|uniref:Uncharacterized protein n=1 Tax=Agromyces humatus TaxID=279573 RepID=A0ABP4X9F3_9MICO
MRALSAKIVRALSRLREETLCTASASCQESALTESPNDVRDTAPNDIRDTHPSGVRDTVRMSLPARVEAGTRPESTDVSRGWVLS